jgi:hypothetical protein
MQTFFYIMPYAVGEKLTAKPSAPFQNIIVESLLRYQINLVSAYYG